MVGNGILHALVFAEIRCDGDIAAVCILLLGLLGIYGLSVPGRTAPCVPGERFLHAEDIVGLLRQFTFAIAGLKDELRHRNGCQDARFLLVCRKQCPYTLYNICLKFPGKGRSLCSLCSCGTTFTIGTTAAKLCCNLGCQITHPRIHPVARTGLVGKPPVNGKDHLTGLRCIVQRLIFIPEPDQLGLSVALADIHAQSDQLLIDHITECIRLRGVGRAFDSDCPLIVGIGGGTPGAVFLLNIKTDPSVLVDAVVRRCLGGCPGEPVSKPLRRTLPDHTMGRDTVNRMCSCTRVVRAEFGVCHQ